MKDNRGFTLTELIIVVAIIGILSMIAIPAYIGQQKRAARTEAYKNLETLRLLEEQFFAENSLYTVNAANVAGIQALMPGFQPGPDRVFLYQITQNQQITNVNPLAFAATGVNNPCFTAMATGIPGTRVAGDQFAIDCNYNKNF